ncbi:MAG: MATE family efflux transporter [Nocardioides sp.]
MRADDREILRLAVPAFLALVAEPLFLLADAIVVGRLGTAELAGLGLAAVVLQTAVGLCVFLAYGSTAVVSRRWGAGDLRGALTQGLDGIWLAVVLGVAITAIGLVFGPALIDGFGAEAAVEDQAITYLEVAVLGVAPLLVMLAATGVLRGLHDTRTPLVVAVAGNAINIVLNVALVHGFGSIDGLGIVGAAIGSVVAQVASALALVAVVVRAARAQRCPLAPRTAGVRAAARAGSALIVRTVTLRAAIVLAAFAVTTGADGAAADIAAHQLAMTLWGFLAFVLDAIAIAAQAITGRHLGAGDVERVRAVTSRMVAWGRWSGVATGLLLAATSPLLGPLFTADAEVHRLLVPVLLVAAAGQPLAGVVFVLDGVLIGAGDGRYLAYAGLAVLVAFVPVVLVVSAGGGGLVGVWVAFVVVFMGGRWLTLTRRARGDQWLLTGPTLSP